MFRSKCAAQRQIQPSAGRRVLDAEEPSPGIASFADPDLYRVGDDLIEDAERLQHAQAILPDIDGSPENTDVAALLVDVYLPALLQQGEARRQASNTSSDYGCTSPCLWPLPVNLTFDCEDYIGRLERRSAVVAAR